jgi:hypothetical protein
MNKTTLEDEKVATITNALDSEVEELEAKVAPGVSRNHNETMIRDTDREQIVLEELEDKVAPGISVNHNETLVENQTSDCILKIEELEMKIAPGRGVNHNETFVSDIAG